jgi:hypothetical protein
MEEQQPITKVFALACELGSANGWENISLQPGCQELSIDEQWWCRRLGSISRFSASAFSIASRSTTKKRMNLIEAAVG